MIVRWRSLRRAQKRSLIREVHFAMGTLLDVALYHADREVGLKILREACREARRLEALLSYHLPTSELSRLNARAGHSPCEVSPELFRVLSTAHRWARRTHGAFDPTLGAVRDLWREAARRGGMPEEVQIQAVLRAGGWSKLRLIAPCQVELTAAGMALDLGGIGKGYAVDQMGFILRQHGVCHALINFGESSLLAIGPRPDGRAWPILVRNLDGTASGESIAIQDQGVSSSASFSQTLTLAGRSLSHVIDPRHGHPVEQPLAVTVLAPTATAAEALSTALLIWGSTGEAIPLLPAGVSAYHLKRAGELVLFRRTSGHATLRPIRL
jgi:thiamine biosynthesis lipoprotein